MQRDDCAVLCTRHCGEKLLTSGRSMQDSRPSSRQSAVVKHYCQPKACVFFLAKWLDLRYLELFVREATRRNATNSLTAQPWKSSAQAYSQLCSKHSFTRRERCELILLGCCLRLRFYSMAAYCTVSRYNIRLEDCTT